MDETIRTGRIAHLAKKICGEEMDDEISVLYAHTASAELESRIKKRPSDEDFVMAAAFIAASEMVKASALGGGFRAGGVSMDAPEAKNVRETALAMRSYAEALLYGKLYDDGFVFGEVEG